MSQQRELGLGIPDALDDENLLYQAYKRVPGGRRKRPFNEYLDYAPLRKCLRIMAGQILEQKRRRQKWRSYLN